MCNPIFFFFKLIIKRKLKSDDHQFHQYQQNEQFPPQLNTKKTTAHDVGNSGRILGQAQKCGRVKLVKGIPTLPS